jgi:hypothetical protein
MLVEIGGLAECTVTDREGKGVLGVKRDRKTVSEGIEKPENRSKNVDKARQGHVGAALKTVYQETVEESIPQEFIDLLGKLA